VLQRPSRLAQLAAALDHLSRQPGECHQPQGKILPSLTLANLFERAPGVRAPEVA